MQKPQSGEYNPYFERYIQLVPEGSIIDLFDEHSQRVARFFEDLPEDRTEYRYAPGKWTPKEVLMHVIDTDRVMAYRALVAARQDNHTPLPPVDEDWYAAHVEVSHRSMADLVQEFIAVRKAASFLFHNIPDDYSRFLAHGSPFPVSARALAYIMTGHALHHMQVVRERYLEAKD
ncbi:MAG TPA: DinB family protein [Saprospiraceae bacterium]|nr:DinB family protein [Saprospiraceae bacterium]